MTGITRRQFTMATAAGLLGTAIPLRAQELPRTYAGSTLNIMSRTSPPFDPSVRLGEEFTQATGIKLNVTRIAPSDHYAKLMLDWSSGTNAFDVSLFVYQWKADLAPFLADLTNVDKDVPGAPSLDLDDYAPKVLEVYGKNNGKLVGLPVLGDVAFMLYNKEIYKAKGLDPEKGPLSWEEIVARGKQTMSDGVYGYALPAGKTPQCYVMWSLLQHSFGGQFFDKAGNPDLANEASLKAIKFMAEQLQPISPPGNLTWDYNEVLNSFQQGKSAHAVMWAGGLGALSDPAKSTVAGKFGAVMPPGGALLGGTSIGVNAKAKNPEAARLYVAWLTSKAIVQRTAAVGTSPARLSVLRDAALGAKYPHYQALAQAFSAETFGYIPVKEAEQVLLMIADEANAACAKTKTPEQAVADLQAKTTQFMKRRGYLK
ncbi:sugar ABC transporter substrate-binding protein [Neorhizobium sp. P12A]|uniref:ABC transporter substrate-binding protein n=1 Tax=Neorhizobium sp. P12A TaxID=2268027 RepID=UPI00165EAE43|nr:sugar ABC transporter substrate-binding protein [Neorhizobium sp. P12A]